MGLDYKDSEVTMKKSELIQPDKSCEILEYQDYNMTLDEWEALNDRASIFYEFNSQLKAFSTLLANCQAL